jgi:hypothetical protein
MALWLQVRELAAVRGELGERGVAVLREPKREPWGCWRCGLRIRMGCGSASWRWRRSIRCAAAAEAAPAAPAGLGAVADSLAGRACPTCRRRWPVACGCRTRQPSAEWLQTGRWEQDTSGGRAAKGLRLLVPPSRSAKQPLPSLPWWLAPTRQRIQTVIGQLVERYHTKGSGRGTPGTCVPLAAQAAQPHLAVWLCRRSAWALCGWPTCSPTNPHTGLATPCPRRLAAELVEVRSVGRLRMWHHPWAGSPRPDQQK